jgi:hypothetical protein
MRVTFAPVVLLLAAGCSYDWGSVAAYTDRDASTDGMVTVDPRHTILPGFTCNPVSMDRCTDHNYCLGMVELDQTFSALTCYGAFGSGSQGTYCDGAMNCVPGFLCWTDPADGTGATHTCEIPCFSDADCTSGHCDTTGRYALTYGRATLYRCQ